MTVIVSDRSETKIHRWTHRATYGHTRPRIPSDYHGFDDDRIRLDTTDAHTTDARTNGIRANDVRRSGVRTNAYHSSDGFDAARSGAVDSSYGAHADSRTMRIAGRVDSSLHPRSRKTCSTGWRRYRLPWQAGHPSAYRRSHHRIRPVVRWSRLAWFPRPGRNTHADS